MLITEDKKIHQKAYELGIFDRVFSIESFLEKVISENPELKDYDVLSVRREHFGNINIDDTFFRSLKDDYQGFDKWFSGKSDQYAYICRADEEIVAFLYLKVESNDEPYPDISPTFPSKKRLKIGTFKVALNGYRIGERFLKILFDNALNISVNEIYVTTFTHRNEQKRLIHLLEEYGFNYWGKKKTEAGEEDVYTRDFSRNVNLDLPKSTFPYLSNSGKKWIVSIYPEYHTNLFPDSILKTESPSDFIENEPFRNAITKVFISRSINKSMKRGDVIVFYRTGGYFLGVISTICIVENVITEIQDEDHFVRLCRKRSVFTDEELRSHWNYKRNNRPFVVHFLYSYSIPKRINLKRLIEMGIIHDIHSVPRGFETLADDQLTLILKESESNGDIIVD